MHMQKQLLADVLQLGFVFRLVIAPYPHENPWIGTGLRLVLVGGKCPYRVEQEQQKAFLGLSHTPQPRSL
ncbi:MAG: hypothetical protein ABIU05_04035 [Nitrospirales bacterium]